MEPGFNSALFSSLLPKFHFVKIEVVLCRARMRFSRGFPHQPGHTSLQADWGPAPVALVGQDAARAIHPLLGWDHGTGDVVPMLWPCQSPLSHRNAFDITEWGPSSCGSPRCSQSLLSIINHSFAIAAYTVSCLQDFPD